MRAQQSYELTFHVILQATFRCAVLILIQYHRYFNSGDLDREFLPKWAWHIELFLTRFARNLFRTPLRKFLDLPLLTAENVQLLHILPSYSVRLTQVAAVCIIDSMSHCRSVEPCYTK